MGKIKIPRKSTWVDMTAMTDVAFLLLTFFMLATQFKPDEAVIVDTPSSTSDVKLPGSKVIQITLDKQGRIFFGVEGQEYMAMTLDRMAEKRGMSFTAEEKETFSQLSSFAAPLADLRSFLNMTSDQQKAYNLTAKGIPCDSTQADSNELKDWLIESRRVTQGTDPTDGAVIAIKGDREANYPVVKDIINTLQVQKANRFNFVTSMEAPSK